MPRSFYRYSGMLPCFFGGFDARLAAQPSSAEMILRRSGGPDDLVDEPSDAAM